MRLVQSGGVGSCGEEKKTQIRQILAEPLRNFISVYLRFSYGAELGETELSLFLELHRQKTSWLFSHQL